MDISKQKTTEPVEKEKEKEKEKISWADIVDEEKNELYNI